MTTACVRMPTQAEIETFYCALLGSDVMVKSTDNACSDEQFVVAEFREPDGELRYLIAIDLALACGLGAALTVIPAAVAKESLQTRVIADNIRENLQEVLNVCTSLFSVGMHGHHLAIGDVFVENEMTEQATEDLKNSVEAESFTVDVPRYMDGVMTVYRMAHEDFEE